MPTPRTSPPTLASEVTWQMTNDDVYNNFAKTGDWMRSALPALESVIDAGIRSSTTVMRYVLSSSPPFWLNVDFIVNYQGVEDMLTVMKTASSAELNKAALQTYTIASHSAVLFKIAGNVSYMRIVEAGHEHQQVDNEHDTPMEHEPWLLVRLRGGSGINSTLVGQIQGGAGP
ncbi:hypothetical protein B0H14DRAFT_3649064 [Mycena olivaceomarginata]|nr:hypothetical protein B0H14DRAFT_3649064 [Mycena olivaceomarginata]